MAYSRDDETLWKYVGTKLKAKKETSFLLSKEEKSQLPHWEWHLKIATETNERIHAIENILTCGNNEMMEKLVKMEVNPGLTYIEHYLLSIPQNSDRLKRLFAAMPIESFKLNPELKERFILFFQENANLQHILKKIDVGVSKTKMIKDILTQCKTKEKRTIELSEPLISSNKKPRVSSSKDEQPLSFDVANKFRLNDKNLSTNQILEDIPIDNDSEIPSTTTEFVKNKFFLNSFLSEEEGSLQIADTLRIDPNSNSDLRLNRTFENEVLNILETDPKELEGIDTDQFFKFDEDNKIVEQKEKTTIPKPILTISPASLFNSNKQELYKHKVDFLLNTSPSKDKRP